MFVCGLPSKTKIKHIIEYVNYLNDVAQILLFSSASRILTINDADFTQTGSEPDFVSGEAFR